MNETKTLEASSTRFAALGYKNFRYLWSGLIVSNMGTCMQNVANGWLVLLGFSFAVPMVILSPCRVAGRRERCASRSVD